MSKTLFLTGAAGFVGSAALQHVMENTSWRVICPSTMRHYGDQSRLRELREKYGERIHVVPCDLAMPFHADLFGLRPGRWISSGTSRRSRTSTGPWRSPQRSSGTTWS